MDFAPHPSMPESQRVRITTSPMAKENLTLLKSFLFLSCGAVTPLPSSNGISQISCSNSRPLWNLPQASALSWVRQIQNHKAIISSSGPPAPNLQSYLKIICILVRIINSAHISSPSVFCLAKVQGSPNQVRIFLWLLIFIKRCPSCLYPVDFQSIWSWPQLKTKNNCNLLSKI